MTIHDIRPEARPTLWKNLDEHQKEAFRHIVNMIHEAASCLPAKSEKTAANHRQRLYPWIDEDRSSRTAFLSGERGTGKSTVLLCLIKAAMDNHYEIDGEGAEELLKKIEYIRNHVIWLEPIDLDPIPKDWNILTAILVRIEEAFDRVSSTKANDNEYNALCFAPGFEDARSRLTALQRSATMIWDGNLSARAGELDCDVFAIETISTERSRIGLNKEVATVLDRLAEHIDQTRVMSNPIFILPIDDCDLNPASSVDVLRILRMISVPRLFNLVLGNIDGIDLIMNLKYTGDILQAGLATNLATIPKGLYAESENHANRIAAHAKRKLLPPSQRVSLGSLALVEALNFLPLGHDAALPLHVRLEKCKMRFGDHLPEANSEFKLAGKEIISLRDFILVEGLDIYKTSESTSRLWERKKNEKWNFDENMWELSGGGVYNQYEITRDDLQKACYTGRYMLCTTLRHVSNFWFSLTRYNDYVEQHIIHNNGGENNVGERKNNFAFEMWKKGISLFVAICSNALMLEPAFTVGMRRIIRQQLSMMHLGQWDFSLFPVKARILTQSGPICHNTQRQEFELENYEQVLRFDSVKEWFFIAYDPLTANEDERADEKHWSWHRLAADATGALACLHDLMDYGPELYRVNSPLLKLEDVIEWRWAVVQWRRGAGEPVELFWRGPPCITYCGIDIFRSAWNSAIKKLYDSGIDAKTKAKILAYTWIAAGNTVVFDEKPNTIQGNPIAMDWEKLGVQLGKHASDEKEDKRGIRHRQFIRWLCRVALMIMPESGLPDISDLYMPPINSDNGNKKNLSSLIEFWKTHQRVIKEERTKNLAIISQADIETQGLQAIPENLGDLVNKLCPHAFNGVERTPKEDKDLNVLINEIYDKSISYVLERESVSNDDEKQNKVQEFESKNKKCAMLIVNSTNLHDKWTIAGINAAGQFNRVLIEDPNDDLLKELKKKSVNEGKVIAMAKHILLKKQLNKALINLLSPSKDEIRKQLDILRAEIGHKKMFRQRYAFN